MHLFKYSLTVARVIYFVRSVFRSCVYIKFSVFPPPDGRNGTNGNIGLPGKKGSAGRTGVPGEPGVPGKHGMPGHVGPPGDDGIPGTDGLNGTDGTPGDRGPTVRLDMHLLCLCVVTCMYEPLVVICSVCV